MFKAFRFKKNDEILRNKEKKLVGLMLFDHQKDGLSAVYSFYDIKFEKSGLGNFMILELIELAKKTYSRLRLFRLLYQECT